MSITEISVKRPTLIVVLFTIISFFGFIGYQNLTYELMPDMSFPMLTVSTVYPGASPSEVESSVSKKIEDAVSTLENLDMLQTISQEGVSIVMVQLKYGSDVDKGVADAQRKLDAIIGSLPEDIIEPSIGKFSMNDMPIMRIGASSDMDAVSFTDLFEKRIQQELARIEGVAQVGIIGGEKREIKINVNPDKLKYYNVSILQVSQAIAQANLDFPTGSLRNKDQDILVRLSGKIKGLEELRNLVVTTTSDNSPVYLADVAEVFDDKKETETISRINGKASLGITISKQSDGNTVEVAEKVKLRLAELEKEYASENLVINIASDSSIFTMEAADSVIHDLLIAIVLVALIMLFFLHNIRNAVIVMVAIPVSIIATFAVMSLAGFTLNLMTLLALSLVIGILVDDSIVVLENIHSHQERGKSPREAAIAVWDEMGLSVISITLVIVVVFLPIGMVTGIVSDLLRQFSLVVVAATLISLLVSFTLTPYLASRFSKLSHLNAKNPLDWPIIAFEKLINSIQSGYESILTWSLNHKFVSVFSIFAMVFASFTLMTGGYIGSEFASSGDNGEFQIKVELPKESPIELTNAATQQIEAILLNKPEVISVFTTVGQSSGQAGSSSSYMAELNVKLVPAEARNLTSNEYARAAKNDLKKVIPGAKISAAAVSMMGGTDAAPIQIGIEGTDLDEMLAFSEVVQAAIKKVPGTAEVKSTVEGGNPEISVNIDRDRLADLGLTIDAVGATMQNAFTGNTNNKFRDGDYEYDIRVQLDAFDRRNISDISSLNFLNNKGELIKLSQFAAIESSTGPSRLERKDKVTSLTIESQIIGRSEGVVGTEIQTILDGLTPPKGVSINAGGSMEQQAEAFGSLGTALLTSILLVYLIMVALYDSYIYPLVVMFSIPVALIGALLALALAMENLSIFGMLGLIMLIGLVVKNAILIVDFVGQLKDEGMHYKEAIVKGTMARFRPILMTTIAMVIAMVPIAVASGPGSEWKNGLAWVLIGGLTSSMILTLIIVPIMYQVVDSAKERIADFKDKRKDKDGEQAQVVVG